MDKKEAIRQYKRTVQPMGIYQIKNRVNGKIFIGSAKHLQGRLNREKFQLENNLHSNKGMQKDFIDHGADAFSFEILDSLEPKTEENYDYSEDLKMLEQMWLEKLQPYDEKGYNKKVES